MIFSTETNLSRQRSASMAVWLAFILLLTCFNLIYSRFLPIDGIRLGHDYSFMFPAWLDGLIWFQKNGFDIPWFTPSFCAGQPFFPDPQSTYYSIPQLVNLITSPLNTAFFTLLFSATLLYWGGYHLMRRVFLTSPAVAVFVGGILMFNGFLPHRILVGHITFHGFALIPWICLLLLMPVQRRVNGIFAAIAAGMLLAYWVHSGFGTLMLPGALSILAIGLVVGLQRKPFSRFILRGALATGIAIGLSIAKLWAAFSFLSNFPRTEYLIPGATSFTDTVIVIASSLFLPSAWSYAIGSPKLENVQWEIGPHEWAYNFGLIIVVFGLVLIARSVRIGWPRVSFNGRQLCFFFLLILCLIVPLAFNFYEPKWNAFLKTVPIINSTSAPIRWIIIYIPIIAVAIGLLFDRAKWQHAQIPIAGACLLFTVLQSGFEPRGFYSAQGYDARPISIADSMLRTNEFRPHIFALDTDATARVRNVEIPLIGNDTFIAGVSQTFCYNPVFGYRLEKFSAADLQKGSVLAVRDGYLNLKNPACYVYPDENGCKPGDRFRVDQIDDAKAFIEYRPFAFKLSANQERANLISKLSLYFVFLSILIWLFLFAFTSFKTRTS